MHFLSVNAHVLSQLAVSFFVFSLQQRSSSSIHHFCLNPVLPQLPLPLQIMSRNIHTLTTHAPSLFPSTMAPPTTAEVEGQASQGREVESKREHHPMITKLEKVKRLGAVEQKVKKQTPKKICLTEKEKDVKHPAEKTAVVCDKEDEEMRLIGSGLTSETDRMRWEQLRGLTVVHLIN